MTDSMKFGPEWLRNMSADSTSSSMLSSGSTAGGGAVMSTSSNSNNGGNGSGHQSFGITSKFRYGREEMLSLFDKNYNMPEILPTFKKIFVEKAQLPLALTPSTDEELLPQVPPVTTQRPSWMQRSPVGFNNSTRGGGRGGSVDRGRMRGKPNYHQIYQRPVAMFGEDDPRSIPLKTERGWPERNGGGDSSSIGGSNMCGISSSSDWSGTPTLSPRKEFCSHPRNLENWRRNRNEDGSGDAPSSGLGSTEGWRGNTGTGGNFAVTHRWGRSTSWRDEDIASSNITDMGYSGSGHNLTMQRSYSTITTVNERGGYISSSAKAAQNSSNGFSGNQASGRTLNILSGLSTPLVRSSQWNSHSAGIGNSSGGDGEDNLPEWAMENPLEGGGTFDSSGAFHGSVDDTENEINEKQSRKKSDCSSESSARNNEGSSVRDSKSSETSTGRTTASLENKSNLSDSSEHSPSCTPVESLIELPSEKSSESKSEAIEQKPDTKKHASPQTQQNPQNSDMCSRDVTLTTVTSSNSYYSIHNAANKINTTTDGSGSVHRDLSDRMREVTDNMIEKLIMEDDTIGISDNNDLNVIKQDAPPLPVQVTVAPHTPAANNLCAPNAFTTVAAMLKQPPRQPNEGPVSVSPTLAPVLTDGLHKGIQLFGGGVVVDHATMQHHHMQQQQLAAAAAANISSVGHSSHGINSTTLTAGPTDLWYYRDPQSKVQGPFTAIEMTEWYRAGYFNENLFVRRFCDTHFRSLGELIKICNDNMPFTHSHLIPNLDNMHLANPPALGQAQKPQTTGDYSLKQQTHQQAERQQQQRDQIKSNLSPSADFLSGNVKNIIPVDVSNMYLQMIRHHEMLIYNEFSENECFQQLTPSEKEAVVRQKMQLYVEYLPNRSGLSNSLAAMNHSGATNQMYDIIDGAKNDLVFSGTGTTGYPNVPQQPPPNTFLEQDDFLLRTQQHPQPIQTVFNNNPFANVLPTVVENSSSGKLNRVIEDQAGNELLNNFNMGMFLPSNHSDQPMLPNPKPQEFIGTPNSDFLNEAQLLVARNSLGQNNSLALSWLPSVAIRASHQSPNEWQNNLLVGIPMTVASVCNSNPANANNMTQEIQQQTEQHPQKIIPASMWDLPTLEHTQGDQIKSLQQVECEPINYENHKSSNVLPTPARQDHSSVNDEPPKKLTTTPDKRADTPTEIQQQNSPTVILPTASPMTKQLKDETVGKQHNGSTKRAIKQSIVTSKNLKVSEDSACSKKNEDDRRRDQADDKRRQKEDKKRQQADEEKRRQQQLDDEKRRQMLEEKERQHQIHAQRRQAMLGNNTNANNSSGLAESVDSTTSKPFKENQRIQSSVAPWSTQSNSASLKGGPCLAEIQKAERRERQMEQRQMEMFLKRVRASATAAVEAFDSMLKWNAPVKDVPVKSFAEIQAEEAKRLANEQIEMQRRKEQEQQQVTAAMSATSNAGGGSNNISAIWSSTKVWGSTSTTGFWEEPIKFSAAVTANSNSGGGLPVAFSSINNTISKQSSTGQQKLSSSASAGNATITASGPIANQQQNASRNLRKSQTVSIMQSAGTQNGKSSKNNNQQPSNNAGKPGPPNKTLLRAIGNNVDGGIGADRRALTKNQSNIGSCRATAPNNKRDDYETEFIAWCTKSLNNMNTKLDVPTFVTFLRDLESPYEVRDYIRMYLGENKESTDFGKQFLERRSKYKNLQRAQNAHNDDMCKPAPAITPSGNDNFDNKGKQKKVKKNKMTKLDARILGFSVTAAEGRTNVGDRAYVDAP
ncbi:GIGYF family protein Gyf isoform X2 [Bactrocera oleae]|uniref:GIGYF family protein Gyf isoform X2 n=1 Tax=Bactrocera oleae TaxID=104688 RepID=UPI0006B71C0A|nr:GIGYF family protein CG11148 isoform X2 [Bactrocera oleae]XP_036232608.1 GIGYF family protein CG11148 isoform X2 [Bactrocera oleae]